MEEGGVQSPEKFPMLFMDVSDVIQQYEKMQEMSHLFAQAGNCLFNRCFIFSFFSEEKLRLFLKIFVFTFVSLFVNRALKTMWMIFSKGISDLKRVKSLKKLQWLLSSDQLIKEELQKLKILQLLALWYELQY